MYKKPKSEEHNHDKDGSGIGGDLVTALLEKRIVLVEGNVTSSSMTETISQIVLLNYESRKPITMFVNSEGGDMYSALGLIDVMRGSRARILTVCTGLAASAGALILAAGHRRCALPSSQIMVHCHWQSYADASAINHHDLLVEAKQSEKMFAATRRFLMDVTGHDDRTIEQLLERDTWLTAVEAATLKIVDIVTNDLLSLVK